MVKIILVVLGLLQLQAVYGRNVAFEALYGFNPDVVITARDFKDVPESDVSFRLWTRGNDEYEELFIGKTEDAKTIRKGEPFIFITHGFQSGADAEWVINMKDAYLFVSDVNVVTVDWSKPAAGPAINYPNAAANTRDVGKHIGVLLVELSKVWGLTWNKVHLVGHSLGAHTSGFAGKTVQKLGLCNVERITGLDPAGPWFNGANRTERLDYADAETVEAIHTDTYLWGYKTEIGTIDFWPNGTPFRQPGCWIDPTCSHLRVNPLFVESIRSNQFVARECKDINTYKAKKCHNNEKAIMGEGFDGKLTGSFMLTTNGRPPYARNDVP